MDGCRARSSTKSAVQIKIIFTNSYLNSFIDRDLLRGGLTLRLGPILVYRIIIVDFSDIGITVESRK